MFLYRLFQAREEKAKAEAAAAEAEKLKNHKPWEQEKPKPLPSIKQNNKDQPQGHPVVQAGGENHGQHRSTHRHGEELPPLNLEALINTTDRSLLEKLSEDIVCGTLPVDRLRRLLPSEEKPSGSSYPIMSNYRRLHMLPDGK